MSDTAQPPAAGDDDKRHDPRPSTPEPGPVQPLSDIRASDAEREDVVTQLGEHASTGRLTLAELDERLTKAYAARTRGELDILVTDLPSAGTRTGGAAGSVATSPAGGEVSRWLVAVMGGSDRQGRWRVAEQLNTVAIMGGHTIDLRNAELTSQETTIVVISIMGGSDIIVPDSIELTVGGFSVMGGNSEYGVVRPPAPGAPRLRILAYNIMGGSDIYRVPDEAREMSVRHAKKFTKKQQKS